MKRIPIARLNCGALIIERAVCEYFVIRPEKLWSRSRKWGTVWPRWVCIGLIHRKLGAGPSDLADLFGRDHTVMVYALKGLEDELATNRALAREFAEVEAALPDLGCREECQMPLALFHVETLAGGQLSSSRAGKPESVAANQPDQQSRGIDHSAGQSGSELRSGAQIGSKIKNVA